MSQLLKVNDVSWLMFLLFIFGKVMQGRMGQGHEWKLQISILVLLSKMPYKFLSLKTKQKKLAAAIHWY